MIIGTKVKVTVGPFKNAIGTITGITGNIAPFHYLVDIGITILVRGDEIQEKLHDID